MIKLYLKTISASLFILLLILLGFYLSFSYSIRAMSQKVYDILGVGNFSVIEQILVKSEGLQGGNSISTYNKELTKLFPQNIRAAQVIDMNSPSFTAKEKMLLLAGSIVYKNEKNTMFLTYSLHDVYAYKRLGTSQNILKILVGLSMNEMIQSSTYMMKTLVLNTLKRLPMNQWNEALDKLQLQYRIPLKLVSDNNKNINDGIIYDIPLDENPITTVYFKIPDSEKTIRVGPLNYPYFSLRLSNIQIYFVVTITLLLVFAVAVLTWLFSRNSAKIHQLTQQYSQGNFDYHVKLNRFSTLSGIYTNVVAMGNKIKLLLQSQQNMARFVAHEVRTPLFTIQLALDSLKNLKTQSTEEQEHIESMEEDIQELNKLINSFLLYSQSSTHELIINKELLNLREWLENIVKNHQSYRVELLFNYQKIDNELIDFDPKLLHHALNNLISNALKFAHKMIVITLEYQNKSVIIRIEDDGPGVPKSDREKIVEPFNTLNSKDTTGKHIGLGLSITKSILDLHEGILAINDSKALKGASFCLILPRLREEPADRG